MPTTRPLGRVQSGSRLTHTLRFGDEVEEFEYEVPGEFEIRPARRPNPENAALARGRAKAGKTMEGFDIVANTAVVMGPDPQECAHALRANAALYIGGMGSREKNFYNQLAVRMGFEEDAAQVQELFLDGKYKEALAQAKRLGDGLERSDAYRSGQARVAPLPQNNGVQ